MSSIEEINRKIEEATKEIGEVQTAITTLENDLETKKNHFRYWQTEKKQLREKENKIRDEKKELQAQKTLLLEERKRQSVWNFNQFLDWLNLVQYKCRDNCITSCTKPKQELKETLDDYYTFESMYKFSDAFNVFKKRIENKFSQQQLNPISDRDLRDCLFLTIGSHDELKTKLMSFLKECRKTLFPEIKIEFIPRPNQEPEFSDLYCLITDTHKRTFTRYLAEVKTTKQVNFESTDILKQLENKDDHLCMAIYQTAGQLLEASQDPRVGLLTCHDYTYLLYLDKVNCTVEISPIIKRQEFLQAVLLVLSISLPQFSDALDFTFDNFKADFILNSLESTENQSTSTQNGNHGYYLRCSNSNNQPSDATKLDDSDDSGIECYDLTLAELIKSRKDMTFIGYGGCGVVFRIHINGNSYADKFCSIYKSKQWVLDELQNEYQILTKLNTTFEAENLGEKFFPRVYFYGPIYVTMHIVMDFIDGRTYNNFKEVSVEEKEQCLQRVEQLHAIKLLHGDLRAPNFIMTSKGVFLIDFGRSKFVKPGEEQQLDEEMDDFRHLIKIT